MSNILFVASEVFPLIKTGGLADVAASLPRALTKLKHDVRILLPAYAAVMNAAQNKFKKIQTLDIDGQQTVLWKTSLPGTRIPVWLVDTPAFSQREGNPYCGPDGNDWPDNAQRFLLFARAARLIALNEAGLDWPVDIVHCNDWQTGLIPALLAQETRRPATVFTIHNLAYRGLFSWDTFASLGLPADWWHMERLEFYNQFCFMKGGLVYADRITTVSPSYAQEIQTPEAGHGLDGLLRHRKEILSGILNGIDTDEWNPGTDKYIAQIYNRRALANKLKNKAALQTRCALDVSEKPLLGFIGRLVEQKGIDLIIANLPQLLQDGCQCVILGSGMKEYEQQLTQLAQQYPQQLAVTIGYDESLAHLIEAGADIFLMPSSYEPCGLNQLYSLRYGTPPVVHAVGGLRDSVIDYAEPSQVDATGFLFYQYTTHGLYAAIQRALEAWRDKTVWRLLQNNGMAQDLSWQRSAQEYTQLYGQLLQARIQQQPAAKA